MDPSFVALNRNGFLRDLIFCILLFTCLQRWLLWLDFFVPVISISNGFWTKTDVIRFLEVLIFRFVLRHLVSVYYFVDCKFVFCKKENSFGLHSIFGLYK